VSRRHAELTYDAEADVWVLADLKSVNGTFVNRKRVTRTL
jgi:pSer/pThr/pTyr-binding forkhead associated (FHA) protein